MRKIAVRTVFLAVINGRWRNGRAAGIAAEKSFKCADFHLPAFVQTAEPFTLLS
jgi:ABC-type arginine transport system permease subunit